MRFACLTAVLLVVLPAFAVTLTINVKDPRGAAVSGAGVAVIPPQGSRAQSKTTDRQGRARFDLPTGRYHLSVTHSGFQPAERDAEVENRPLDLTVSLTIGAANTTMQVSAKRSPLANSDPNYQALRKGRLSQVWRVANLTLTRDAGIFTFRSGAFSFLPPVLGHVTTGVFVGAGN
ncbi:MAG TPA: carboxypeptidase-like regulatory domain-containing protein, partial [Bryobacteraceae bacterium]|nr:carboxypeptidase-like regulatory domain-containing protein [Bryobacteraceae bacterium]